MVLPAIIGGLASGIGGGVASGLFGLLGGGGKSQAQSFDPQAFLNSYADQMRSINKELISYLDDKTTEYEDKLSGYRQANDQTKSNFKSNADSYLKTATDAVNSGALSSDQAWGWYQDLANNSGLSLGSTINDKGNTLLDVKTAFDTKKLEEAPKEWNRNLETVYRDYLGRGPTLQEAAKYNLKDYNNIQNVIGSLARNDREFYDRNIRSIDPAMAAARDFWGGGQTYKNNYARFGLSPETGKPA